MIIETTIYIRESIIEELSKASDITGRSKNFILMVLLKRVMNDSYRLVQGNSPVKYQDSDPSQRWYRLHIQLNEYEYEYCLDMRKFYKRSVSLIFAYAVSNYLDEIINLLLGKDMNTITDNYQYKNYILIQEVIDSMICWRIYWGIPNNIDKIIKIPLTL